MWEHYIYIHFRESDGVPFYVGKGTSQPRDKNLFARACEPHKNIHWERTVNKHGIIINILMSCQNDKEAQEQEKRIILDIGRQDLSTGTLVNKTDGGDGCCGLIISDELRKKRSINSSESRSQVWIASIREARKDGGNGGVVKHGDKLPEEWIKNLALAKLGNKNPMFGKVTKIARKVIADDTGKIYESVSAAAIDFKMNMKSLYNMLSGHRNNYIPLRFYDGV